MEDGDIVNIDVSTYLPNGYHGDTSRTFLSGQVDEDGKRLVQVNELALAEAIKRCGPGVPFNLIGSVIQDISDAHGFSSVRDFTGHGIGKQFHLKPFILHYRNNEPGVMEPGMVFTIEPMFCEGEMHVGFCFYRIYILNRGCIGRMDGQWLPEMVNDRHNVNIQYLLQSLDQKF